MRTLGMTEAAEADWQTLDEESRAALEAYAAGVNAYLELAGSDLPPEFKILGLRPEPWQPVDSLVFGKLLAWGLSNNYYNELILASIAPETTWENLLELLPEYPGPDVIPDAQSAALSRTAASLLDFGLVAETLNPLLRPDQGSNAWVVGGSHTASGLPLLANDPHQTLSMPSLWYEVGLHSQDGVYDVVGGSLPGIPGIEIGHNAYIAWGVTNARPDVQDLFIETLNEDGTQYLFQGEWRDLTFREETIQVKGAEPVTLTVRITHHGPLVSDVVEEAEGDLALRWTGLDGHPLLQAVLGINRARDWDEFRAAVADWEVPGMNFVYADVEGNIGYQMSGQVPIRASNDVLGVLPVDGADGAHEWTGFIPFEEMPYAINPSGDFFASANNRPVGPDDPHFFSRYFQPPYRVSRISQAIRDGQNLTPEDFAALQADWHSAINLAVAQALVAEAHPTDPTAQAALDLLRDWDGMMTPDSGAAALSEVALRHVIRQAVAPEIGEDAAEKYLLLAAYPYMFLQNILDDPASPWWHGDRAGALTRALEDAVAELQPILGDDPAAWTWGGMHAMTFAHPLGSIGPLRPVFNRGPYPTGGNWNTVNSGAYYPDKPYAMGLGPAYRIISNPADWDSSISIIPTGQSGHPFSPYYDDQIELWLAVEYHPLPFTPEAIERAAVHTLLLNP
ncbi:MAG: penicillin acylase family protein, partial [Anaerolineae bacterium]